MNFWCVVPFCTPLSCLSADQCWCEFTFLTNEQRGVVIVRVVNRTCFSRSGVMSIPAITASKRRNFRLGIRLSNAWLLKVQVASISLQAR
jgi:hypothetical protein